jgi:hypothetical protein
MTLSEEKKVEADRGEAEIEPKAEVAQRSSAKLG